MSSPMRPPMGAPPGPSPMGPPPGGAPAGPDPATSSMFNPADAAGMLASGSMNENMTVRQVFERMGIDVDEPVKVAAEKLKGQMQGATGLGKAQRMAGGAPPMGGPPGGPPPGGMGGPPPPGAPGLAGLPGR